MGSRSEQSYCDSSVFYFNCSLLDVNSTLKLPQFTSNNCRKGRQAVAIRLTLYGKGGACYYKRLSVVKIIRV